MAPKENIKIFSFDVGIASVGWAYLERSGECIEIKDCGVRIFTKAENPKDGSSLAVPRREARGVRRRLARRRGRLNIIKQLVCKEFQLPLSDYLSEDGVLPQAYISSKAMPLKSPYELRTLALDERLEVRDLARVILHIAKHRGYGNKHARGSQDQNEGEVKKAIEANKLALEKYRTVGEYLYKEFF